MKTQYLKLHQWAFTATVPVVIFFAPFGAYFISNRTRNFIAKLLYTVLIAQFIGAFLIIPAWKSLSLLLFTFGIFGAGLLLFLGFSLQPQTQTRKD